jgi:acetylornithine/succinyldiaminopimelate/putrescine aminotransferase
MTTPSVSPPLVITSNEIDWALDKFDAALRHIGPSSIRE